MPVAILMIPLTIHYEFLFYVKRGDSPFEPGRDHIHHILIDMGMGHRKTSLTLYGMSITITVTSYLLSMWNVNIIMLLQWYWQ